MINIYNIPLYYIGFKKKYELEEKLKDIGFTDINHFESIDGRKMEPRELLTNGVITVRAYIDIVHGREEHIGISSLGTIGCTLSHLELWKKCADNLSYIIIAEDDVIPSKISSSDEKNIQNALKQQNGCFISTSFKKHQKTLIGLHFYILSKGAAQNLVKKALPIDMQTDSYLGVLNNIGDINAKGYQIFHASLKKFSSTGDFGYCIKCILPSGRSFYIIIVLVIIFIFILFIIFFNKWSIAKNELDSCRSRSIQ